jgi:hypothetical protein
MANKIVKIPVYLSFINISCIFFNTVLKNVQKRHTMFIFAGLEYAHNERTLNKEDASDIYRSASLILYSESKFFFARFVRNAYAVRYHVRA